MKPVKPSALQLSLDGQESPVIAIESTARMEESPAHEKGREGFWFRLSLLCEGAGVGKLAKPGFFHSDLVTSELPRIGCFTLGVQFDIGWHSFF